MHPRMVSERIVGDLSGCASEAKTSLRMTQNWMTQIPASNENLFTVGLWVDISVSCANPVQYGYAERGQRETESWEQS